MPECDKFQFVILALIHVQAWGMMMWGFESISKYSFMVKALYRCLRGSSYISCGCQFFLLPVLLSTRPILAL